MLLLLIMSTIVTIMTITTMTKLLLLVLVGLWLGLNQAFGLMWGALLVFLS